jgi:hypothetical protein
MHEFEQGFRGDLVVVSVLFFDGLDGCFFVFGEER